MMNAKWPALEINGNPLKKNYWNLILRIWIANTIQDYVSLNNSYDKQ